MLPSVRIYQKAQITAQALPGIFPTVYLSCERTVKISGLCKRYQHPGRVIKCFHRRKDFISTSRDQVVHCGPSLDYAPSLSGYFSMKKVFVIMLDTGARETGAATMPNPSRTGNKTRMGV